MFTNVTLIFFLLLIPLAGFIAWAGDRIGHKTGKRRQSLLGLRPRHTAMVFTIGSGMAIALVSFGLFYALSETFRVVVRDGAELYRHNRELKAENAKQAQLLKVSLRTTATAQAETEKYNKERQAAEDDLQRVEAKRRDAESRAQTAQLNYTQAAAGRDKAQSGLSLAKTELTEVQRGLKEKTKGIRDAEARITIARQKVQFAENSAKAADAQYKKAATERDNAQKEAKTAIALSKQISDKALRILGEQSKELNGQIASVQERLDKQKKDYADLQTKTDTQRIELANLTKEMDARQVEYDGLVAKSDRLRKRQITFQVGEEVERISLRSGYNVWRLQGMLRSFLGNAAKRAERRGAAKGGEDRAVFIAPQAVTMDGSPLDVGGKGEEDDAIRVAAESIRKLNQEVVILAVSRVNAVAGEPVAVDLKLFRNPVVLKAGAKISEGIISSDGTPQETMRALASYMSKDVHAKLVAAGMLPVSRSAESEANATEAGLASSEFTLNNDVWTKLIEDVRRAGTAARVQVFAAKDMRAGDALSLRFDVHEQPSDQAINKP